MQHTKITQNFGEFQKFIDSDNKTGLCMKDIREMLIRYAFYDLLHNNLILHNFFPVDQGRSPVNYFNNI